MMKNKLYESMEIDFENGCGIVESLKINKVNEKDWKKVLEGYKKWELKEMVVYVDKKNGDVFCRFLEEEGNRYKIEKDGSIKV